MCTLRRLRALVRPRTCTETRPTTALLPALYRAVLRGLCRRFLCVKDYLCNRLPPTLCPHFRWMSGSVIISFFSIKIEIEGTKINNKMSFMNSGLVVAQYASLYGHLYSLLPSSCRSRTLESTSREAVVILSSEWRHYQIVYIELYNYLFSIYLSLNNSFT